jgi:hypothetical protein
VRRAAANVAYLDRIVASLDQQQIAYGVTRTV